MKRIKIAQIGTSENSHGYSMWNTFVSQSDLFEVVGYALPENEREKFPIVVEHCFKGCREMTVEEILNDPEIDAVAVETEEIYLTKYALMVAKAGKHLHMEKPGGFSYEDFKELVCVLKEKNLVFSTGYMYRFNPKIREAIEKVKRGDIGRVYSVEAHMSCMHEPRAREWMNIFPGGMTFFLGCHLIDLIYSIQGEPEEILPLSCSTGIDGIESKDLGMVVYKYPHGVSFIKTCASERGGFTRRQLVICGEKGTLIVSPLEEGHESALHTYLKECYELGWSVPWTETKSEAYDRYIAMVRNFAEMIRGKKNPYSYNYELKLYEIILKSCGGKI